MREFIEGQTETNKRTLFFRMVDESDGITGETGLTITGTLCKADEVSFSAIDGGASEPIVEVGDGVYALELSENDLDTPGEAMLKLTADGSLDQFIPFVVKADDLGVIESKVDTAIADIGNVVSSLIASEFDGVTFGVLLECLMAVLSGKTLVSNSEVTFMKRDGITGRIKVAVGDNAGLRTESVIL